jgi:hypothetical protein
MEISAAKSEAAARCEIQPVLGKDIKAYWPKVKAGIEIILAKMKGTYDLLPEEVYVSLMRGFSFLYLIVLDGEVDGWMIFRKISDDFSQKPVMVVWLGTAESSLGKELGIREAEKLARERKFAKIRIYGRWGWERKPPQGWKVATVVLEKDLG